MATYRVQSDSLQAIADAIRAKAGTSGSLAFPDGFADAIATITTGGTGGGGTSGSALLVDEAIKIVDSITTHQPVYTNEKLLGHLTPTSRYVALWLPVNVPLVSTNHTYAIVACPTYLYANLVGIRNRNDALLSEVMADLVVIQGGIVHVGSLNSSLPIAPGTYRLVVFE